MRSRLFWLRVGFWLFGAVAVLGGAALRVVVDGRADLAASEAAWSAGDVAEATVRARRAALAFVPGASHVPRAYQKLREIAEQSEARGDLDAALFAWRAMRAAAIGSRSWVTSHEAERASADLAIARLSVVMRASSTTTKPAEGGARALRATLAAEVAPSLAWGALFLAGAGLWAGAGVWLARVGFDAEGRFERRESQKVAVLAVAGLAAWMAGVLLR
jgi:hypothetical protein